MSSKALVEKINKILALSQSSNENEAAVAAEKAAKLLAEHHLSLTEVEREGVEEITEEVVERTGRYITWKMLLLAGVASANGCQAMRHKQTGKMRLVGKQTSIIVSCNLYNYLVATINRLAREQKGKGRSFIYAFKLGCATRLRQRLEILRYEMEQKGLSDLEKSQVTPAIVLRSMFTQNQSEIEAYLIMKGTQIKLRNSFEIKSNLGFNSGYVAGDKISLQEQINAVKT